MFLKSLFPAAFFPCSVLPFTAQKPDMFRALRAPITQSTHPSMFLKSLFPAAFFLFETTFPRLLRIRDSCVRPPLVFSLRPRRTSDLAIRPEATLDTRFAFIVLAFIGLAFVGLEPTDFFIGSAMVQRWGAESGVAAS